MADGITPIASAAAQTTLSTISGPACSTDRADAVDSPGALADFPDVPCTVLLGELGSPSDRSVWPAFLANAFDKATS